MIKLVIFDAGGVLFDTFISGDDRVRALLEERGYSISHINTALMKAKQIQLPFITEWDAEEAYYKRYYGAIAEELGETALTQELFYCTHYAAHCELFPEVKGVLEKLSERYRIAIISNAMPSMDCVFDRLGIREYFEFILLSAFVKEEKPGDKIYRIALERANVSAEECVFIDDKLENVIGAEKVGIQGVHLDRANMNLVSLLSQSQLLS